MRKSMLSAWVLESWGALDYRSLDGARASGISYRLANGKEGTINDPRALLIFYTRIYYEDKTKEKATAKWQWTWRRTAQQRTPAKD
jgi:hypothetical protein